MKRAAAIILSLAMIWLQVVASAQTVSTSPSAKCGCCAPKKVCCCVEQSTPDAAPVAAPPASPSTPINFNAVIPKLVAWTLPENAPAIVASSDRSSSSFAIPLFQRDCALLI